MGQHKTNPKLKKWEEFVPEYVSIINNFFLYGKGKGVPVLFVEGLEDKRFYDNIFPIKVRRKAYEINLDKCPVFVEKFNTIDRKYIQQFGAPYFSKEESNTKLKARIEETNQKIEKTQTNAENIGKVLICKFVEEVGKACSSGNYTNIKGFGFVDRDFKVEEQVEALQYNKENLAYTLAHDYETSIFYLFFPKIFKEKLAENKRENFTKKLIKILEFLIKQGVLEKRSLYGGFKLKDDGDNYFLRNISKDNFLPEGLKENIQKKILSNNPADNLFNFEENYFDFNKYYENCLNLLNNDYDKKVFWRFYSSYTNDVKKIGLDNLEEEIKYWLCTEKDDGKLLEKFKLINGHLLWKHLILNFSMELNISDKEIELDEYREYYKEHKHDKALTALLLKYVNKEKLFDNPPLSLYLEFLEND